MWSSAALTSGGKEGEEMNIEMKYKANTNREAEKHYLDETAREEKSTVKCTCGSSKFLVNWIDAPWTGGYLKVTCAECGASKIVFDEFA